MDNGADIDTDADIEEVPPTKEEVVRDVLRGVKDGIRDQVLDWDEVSACFNDKTLDALAALGDKANAKRGKVPKEKRQPWRTKTPADIIAAQQVLREVGRLPLARAERRRLLRTQSSVTTFPAEINGGGNGNG